MARLPEVSVLWFLGQSWLVIVAAVLLGLLVGWLWRGRPRRAEGSAALAELIEAHEALIAAKDSEIAQLRVRVEECEGTRGRGSIALAEAPEDVVASRTVEVPSAIAAALAIQSAAEV